MSTAPLIPAAERHRAECAERARAFVAAHIADSRASVMDERRAPGWTRRAEDLELVERLHAMLEERDELIAAQQDTIAALRVEIAAMRRRHEMTPDAAQALLSLVGV